MFKLSILTEGFKGKLGKSGAIVKIFKELTEDEQELIIAIINETACKTLVMENIDKSKKNKISIPSEKLIYLSNKLQGIKTC